MRRDAKGRRLVRVATVRETGRRYIVLTLNLRDERIALRGEVTKGRGAKSWHAPSFWLDLADVDLTTDVPKTEALVGELFEETVQARRAVGALHRETGRRHRNVTIVGREAPEVVALAAELGVDLATCPNADRIALRQMAREATTE